jgi:hypothetical protein
MNIWGRGEGLYTTHDCAHARARLVLFQHGCFPRAWLAYLLASSRQVHAAVNKTVDGTEKWCVPRAWSAYSSASSRQVHAAVNKTVDGIGKCKRDVLIDNALWYRSAYMWMTGNPDWNFFDRQTMHRLHSLLVCLQVDNVYDIGLLTRGWLGIRIEVFVW